MGMLTGGCFCRQIRYEVTRTPFFETLCHCSIRGRPTGSAVVGWFTVRRSGFRIVSGEPRVFRSSDTATRSFCEHCGTQITFTFDTWPDLVDVTTGSLDEPNALPPKDHTWISSRLWWLHLNDGLPEHSEARDTSGAAREPLHK